VDTDTTQINDIKEKYLNVLNRLDARREVEREAVNHGTTVSACLGI